MVRKKNWVGISCAYFSYLAIQQAKKLHAMMTRTSTGTTTSRITVILQNATFW
jgi:hypothetical protein